VFAQRAILTAEICVLLLSSAGKGLLSDVWGGILPPRITFYAVISRMVAKITSTPRASWS